MTKIINIIDTTFGSNRFYSHEHWGYIEDDWEIDKKFKINAGVHISGLYTSNKWYANIQPRISCRYLVAPKASIKLSYSKMTQYLHLLIAEIVF